MNLLVEILGKTRETGRNLAPIHEIVILGERDSDVFMDFRLAVHVAVPLLDQLINNFHYSHLSSFFDGVRFS